MHVKERWKTTGHGQKSAAKTADFRLFVRVGSLNSSSEGKGKEVKSIPRILTFALVSRNPDLLHLLSHQRFLRLIFQTAAIRVQLRLFGMYACWREGGGYNGCGEEE